MQYVNTCKGFFADEPEIQPFYDRLNDLQQRVLKVESEREDWLIAGETNLSG